MRSLDPDEAVFVGTCIALAVALVVVVIVVLAA